MNSPLKTVLILAFFVSACQQNPDAGLYSSIAEGRVVNVPAMTGGKIVQLHVDIGTMVEEQQILGVIDTTELHIQRRLLKAQFDELAIQARQAGSSAEQAVLQYKYLAEKHERINALFGEKSTSRQSLDDVKNMLAQAELTLEKARQQFQTMASRKMQLEAQLNLLDKKISDAVIYTPRAGIISERFFEQGEAIPPLASLVELIDLHEMEIKIYIGELQLPHVKTGRDADIHIDGVDTALRGKVAWISPQAEFTPKSVLTAENRTSLVYAVKILVSNPDGLIKHGMPVTVELL